MYIDATDDPDPVQLGGELTYDITYGNDTVATSKATGAVLRLTYDPNVSFLSSDVAPDAGTDNQWTLGDLSPGEGGTLSVRVQVDRGNQLTTRATIQSDQGTASADATTRVQSAGINQFATGEIAVAGTVSGDYRDTHALDEFSELITERSSGGAVMRRYSYLEHKWLFEVQPGASVVLYATVSASVSQDDDAFELAYSTDDVNYHRMFTVHGKGGAQQFVYQLPSQWLSSPFPPTWGPTPARSVTRMGARPHKIVAFHYRET